MTRRNSVLSLVAAIVAVGALAPLSGVFAAGYGGGGGGGGGPLCGFGPHPPAGGFDFTVTQDETLGQGQVKLTLNGGSEATYMTISNSPIADNAAREIYSPTKVWNTGDNSNGDKPIYVRFYNVCGFPTPIINHRFPYHWPFIGPKGPTPPPSTPPKGRVLGEKITNIDSLIAQTTYGQRSDVVVQLQDALKAAGFFPASVKSSGYYGLITKAAVAKYKAGITLTAASSIPSDADLDTLVASLKYHDRSSNVASLQTKLRTLGFFPSWVRSTGWFGPITKGAVAKYLASK